LGVVPEGVLMMRTKGFLPSKREGLSSKRAQKEGRGRGRFFPITQEKEKEFPSSSEEVSSPGARRKTGNRKPVIKKKGLLSLQTRKEALL